MRGILSACVLSLTLGVVLGGSSESGAVKPPQVYIYTRTPIEFGKENELICHCNNFHPPVIQLQLKSGDKEYENCQQSDMTFKEDWAYHTTKSIKFTPQEGVKYSCDVQHNNGPMKSYILETLM